MLQQTRVDTVIPYYERFLTRFPDLRSLASAPEEEVLRHWSGLGYYRRARLLHAGVREVVARYGGEVPRERQARLSLPGVGAYTAGAIGRIAFDAAEALVDGNVARVLARLFAIESPLGQSQTEKQLWALAEALVVGEEPGAFNQALMELGALVCTPRNPRCGECPLQADCRAYAEAKVHCLPQPKVRKPAREMRCRALVLLRESPSGQGRECWMVESQGRLFGGLWGPPMTLLEREGTTEEPEGLPDVPNLSHQATVHHVLSHRRLEVEVWKAELSASQTLPQGIESKGRWMALAELRDQPLSKLSHKIVGSALQATPAQQIGFGFGHRSPTHGGPPPPAKAPRAAKKARQG